jgi:hypothetical protein
MSRIIVSGLYHDFRNVLALLSGLTRLMFARTANFRAITFFCRFLFQFPLAASENLSGKLAGAVNAAEKGNGG